MKLRLTLFFVFVFQLSFSQVFHLDKDWFELESFLSDSIIKKHQVEEVKIHVFNKKDGSAIAKTNNKIIYKFDESGNQKQGLIINRFGRRLDSNQLDFTYKNGFLHTKTETYSFFKFQYIYEYNDKGLLHSERKVDLKNRTLDTLYHRKYGYSFNSNGFERSTFNSANKPFIVFKHHKENNILTQKTSFVQSSNFSETRFFYSGGTLSSKELVSKFGKEKIERSEYREKNNRLDESNHHVNGSLVKKRGIIYNNMGLPENIIERNYKSKSIRIYKIEYTFRN